jgi:Skp family chaperone for outer membrane proteins
MKMIRTTLLTISLLACLSLPAFAQTKVATVDMRKLFNGYYKTKSAETILDGKKTELRKELKDMADGNDKAKADYKQLVEQANDQAISAEERDRRKQAVADKLKEINNSNAALDAFNRQAESTLADQSQRMIGNLVTEIQKFIATTAKSGGYAVVLDSSATSAGGTPVVLYTDPATDITAAVLANENAAAPIDFANPATTSPLLMSTNHP